MANNKNLYFIHLYNDHSGSPRVLRDAIDSETGYKENKFLFTSSHNGFLSGANCNYINVPYKRSENKLLVLFYFLIAQIFTFFCLSYYLIKSKIRKKESNVIINTILPFGAGLAAKLFASKVIWYVHETSLEPKILDGFLKFILKATADEVLFVSNYVKSCYKNLQCTQHVFLNGLRGDFLISGLTNPKEKFENKKVLFVGSFKAYKGIYTFFDLAKRLPHLKFVAALNCEEDELNELYSLPDNIEVLIRPDNLSELYNSSTILVNLSHPEQWIETFGLTIIEGFSFGTPAIVPPVGGPIEFTSQQNALQIDSRHFEELKNAIEVLTTDFSLWSSMYESALNTSKDFTTAQFQSRISRYFSIGKSRPK